MRLFDRFLWASALAIAPGTLVAQSCNIDLDLVGASSEVGGGAPSSIFGGAASSQGYWCSVDAIGDSDPVPLFDLDGSAGSMYIVASGGIGVAGGYGPSGNTGDYKLLFDDYSMVGGAGPENDYTFSGFQPGHYIVYTYAARPFTPTVTATVTVPGSSSGEQYVTGPMPHNRFVLGEDYCIHDLNLVGTSFTIQVRGSEPPNQALVNGFQIVKVLPEPQFIGLAALSLGMTLFGRRRRV